MIRLEPITPDNWRPALRVREDQRRFVSDCNVILARAYAYREHRSRAFLVCKGDTPIGMAMYYDIEEWNAYDFSQLFIDERYQGHGYGQKAAELILQAMREDGAYDRTVLCYIEGNDAARQLYQKLGFSHTGESDGDEIIMELRLR